MATRLIVWFLNGIRSQTAFYDEVDSISARRCWPTSIRREDSEIWSQKAVSRMDDMQLSDPCVEVSGDSHQVGVEGAHRNCSGRP
jgi:hypothetical protein